MVDPVTLAVVTSAISSLAAEVEKGAAGELGKSLFQKVCGLFHWNAEAPPKAAELPSLAATTLHASPDLLEQVRRLLEDHPEAGDAAQVVIHAKNVGAGIVQGNQTITFN